MKYLFKICIAIAACCMLAGCARHGTNPNVIELTYAHPSTVGLNPIIEHALDEFMKENPNVHVQDIPIAGDYYSKLMVMIAGNTAPDVMWMGQSFGEFAQRGAFLDIKQEMQSEVDSQKYFSKVVDWYRFKNHLYGFPYGVDCLLYFYNENIFKKAGVPFPQNSWDLQDFLHTALQLQNSAAAKKIPDFYAIGGGQAVFPGAFDAHVLSPDLSHSTVNSPQFIEATQFNYDLKERYHVSPGPATGMTDKNQAFRLGSLAMVTGATWDLPTMKRDVKDFDWDVVLPPRGKKRAIWGSSSGICVFSRTPHPKQSIALLKYLTSPKIQLEVCRNAGCIPSNRATAQQWAHEIKTPQHVENFLKAIPYLETQPHAVALSEISSKLSRANERITTGRATPTAALNNAAAQIDLVIQRQNRLLGIDNK